MSFEKSLAQQIQEDIDALNRKISQALSEKHIDGFVPRMNRIMKATAALNIGVVKYADMNGMMVEEIVLAMNTEEKKVLAALDIKFDYSLRVGAIVEPKDPNRDPLRSGAATYEVGVVISVEPFIMATGDGTMRWTTWSADRVQVVGTAAPAVLKAAMNRLTR